MKSLLLLAVSFILAGCSETEKQSGIPVIESEVLNVVSTEQNVTANNPNLYEEFHEDGSLKIQGRLDKNGARTGLWVSFYPDGTKWSESYYVDGLKDGHSITFYENGNIRYVGEYDNDEQIGEWKFYNEKGELTSTKDYDQN